MWRASSPGPGLLAAAAVLLAASACAHLLGYQDLRGPFEHRAHTVEGIPCVSCHVGIEEAGEQGPLHLPDGAACLSCHQRPHDDGPCLDCHTDPTARVRAQANRANLRFEHARHLAVVPGQCVRCHTNAANEGVRMAAPMAVCFTCHEHQEQFTLRDCGGCHTDLHAEGSMPSEHLIHDMDFGRRHGLQAASSADLCATCHKERFCASCHGVTTPALPARLHFAEPRQGRLHRAGFLSRHAIEARTQVGLCGTCHTETFCASCHIERGLHATATATSPHPEGWLTSHGREARRDPSACAACHSGGGEALCVGCHRVGAAGGNIHPPGWSSTRPITDQPCRRCHIP